MQKQLLWHNFQEKNKQLEMQHKIQLEHKYQVRVPFYFSVLFSSLPFFISSFLFFISHFFVNGSMIFFFFLNFYVGFWFNYNFSHSANNARARFYSNHSVLLKRLNTFESMIEKSYSGGPLDFKHLHAPKIVWTIKIYQPICRFE